MENLEKHIQEQQQPEEEHIQLHPEVTDPEFAWVANQAVNEELDAVYEDFKAARESGKYTKMQEQDVMGLVMKKRRLGENFRAEMKQVIADLPDDKQPTLTMNEKGLANMYLAGHLIGKDVTVRHIAECLAKGEDVTEKTKYAESGSRYFKLDIPEGGGMPGRFVLPSEGGPLGELVANWNQQCEFKIRHGNVVPTIKKSEIPSWLVELESTIYVIVEKNTRQDGSLQIADGPTENDPEGDWIISTAHYGLPSRRKPRLPKERTDENMYTYLEQLDSWSDEQRRVVFVDLEEEGVGQKGPKETSKVTYEGGDPRVAGLENDMVVLKKMLENVLGENQQLKSQIKGLETRQKSNKSK